ASRCTVDTINAFRQVLGAHPGLTEVHLRLSKPGKTTLMRIPDYRVSTTSALMADLKEPLGPGCLSWGGAPRWSPRSPSPGCPRPCCGGGSPSRRAGGPPSVDSC